MEKTAVPKINPNDCKLFEYLNIFKYLDIDFIHQNVYSDRPYYYVVRRVKQLEYYDYIRGLLLYEMDAHNSIPGRKIIIPYDGTFDFLEFNYAPVGNLPKRNFAHIIAHQLFLAKALVKYYDSKEYIDKNEVSFVRLISEDEISISGKYNNFRPDGGFILNVNGNNIIYFVEAERSYAKDHDVIRKVFKQYENLENVVKNLNVFKDENIKFARVLFISSSSNKMENLMKKINKIRSDNLQVEMLFTFLDKLLFDSESNVLSSLYYDLNGETKRIYEN